MSTTTQHVRDEASMKRVLLAKKELYQSGNSLSVSIPPDVLENTPFEVGDPANLFTLIEDREVTITADTRRWMKSGARARGSRKIRESSHGTVLMTIPPEVLTNDLGYESVDAAKGVPVRLTIDPETADLFLEFPDE